MKTKILMPIIAMIILAASASAHTITGQVNGTGLGPLNNAAVTAYSTGGIAYNTTNTDANGSYTLEIGPTGLAIFNASFTGYNTQSIPQFINTDTTINFELGPQPGATLSGTIRNATSNLQNVLVDVKLGETTWAQTTTDAAGDYSIIVLNNQNYNVTASLTGYISQTKPITTSGSTDLDFTLDPAQGCQESWTCGDWGECSGGSQSRTCTDQNHCGTTNNRPALTQSCYSPSGGGGGGGGTSGVTYVIEPERGPETRKLRENDRVRFDFNNKRIYITNIEILEGTVHLVESLNGQHLLIKTGQREKFDLDKNMIYDLAIDYAELTNGRAVLTFSLIQEPVILTKTPTTTKTTTSTTTKIEEQKQEVKTKEANLLEGWVRLKKAEQKIQEETGEIKEETTALTERIKEYITNIPHLKYIIIGGVVLIFLITLIIYELSAKK